eukprot:3593619-Prymnesium_polylepis.1
MGAAHADDDGRVRLVAAWGSRAALESTALPSGLEWPRARTGDGEVRRSRRAGGLGEGEALPY